MYQAKHNVRIFGVTPFLELQNDKTVSHNVFCPDK